MARLYIYSLFHLSTLTRCLSDFLASFTYLVYSNPTHLIFIPKAETDLFHLWVSATGYECWSLISTMASLSLNSNPNSTNLAIPKLHDNRSNWADYSSQIQKAMGSKELQRHVEGNTVVPRAYTSSGWSPHYFRWEDSSYWGADWCMGDANHWLWKTQIFCTTFILLTTSTHPGMKIKDLKTAKEMWDIVKTNATMKSTLYLLDTEDELASMNLGDTEDLKTHLAELKEHFQLMVQHYTNLITMGLVLSNSSYCTIIMHSLPESYCLALQTITAAEWAGAVSGALTSRKIKPDNLMNFFIEEAQHHVINSKCSRNGDSMLAVHGW